MFGLQSRLGVIFDTMVPLWRDALYNVAMAIDRQVNRARVTMRAFLDKEASGGVVLMLAALLALVVANSPLSAGYFALLAASIGGWSLLHIVNDGLMALFFLVVGLEIKREFLDGHLARWRDRVLPLAAAAGGMVVPALIFLAMVGSHAGLARGWAIPAATDIAFAVGVLALLGSRVPPSLKVFLATVAIADDLGAVIIIAIAYTAAIKGPALLAAGVIVAAMFGLNRSGVKQLFPYLVLAVGLWVAVLLSGVHPTVAGVLAATAIPIRPARQKGGEDSPLHRLERGLGPWVAYGVVPLFGFANAGVDIRGLGIGAFSATLPVAIALGLFLGKQIGIFATVRICVALGLGSRPHGASWSQLYGLSLLCGIGFTMSLFIGGLAFGAGPLADEVRIGVLTGSLLSAVAGLVCLRIASTRKSQ